MRSLDTALLCDGLVALWRNVDALRDQPSMRVLQTFPFDGVAAKRWCSVRDDKAWRRNGRRYKCAVLQQLAAIRGAVSGLMAEVLESHLRDTFGDVAAKDAAKRSAQDESVQQAITLVRSYLK